MRYFLVIIALGWCLGCSTKQKLQQRAKSNSETKFSQEMEAQRYEHYTMQKKQSDSNAAQQWLKIYPKGEVQIGHGTFNGQIDSLLWYSHSRSLKQYWQMQQHDTLTKYKRQITLGTVAKSEEQVKEKQKTSFLGWYWCLALLVLALLFGLVQLKSWWRG